MWRLLAWEKKDAEERVRSRQVIGCLPLKETANRRKNQVLAVTTLWFPADSESAFETRINNHFWSSQFYCQCFSPLSLRHSRSCFLPVQAAELAQQPRASARRCFDSERPVCSVPLSLGRAAAFIPGSSWQAAPIVGHFLFLTPWWLVLSREGERGRERESWTFI